MVIRSLRSWETKRLNGPLSCIPMSPWEWSFVPLSDVISPFYHLSASSFILDGVLQVGRGRIAGFCDGPIPFYLPLLVRSSNEPVYFSDGVLYDLWDGRRRRCLGVFFCISFLMLSFEVGHQNVSNIYVYLWRSWDKVKKKSYADNVFRLFFWQTSDGAR